MLKKIYSSIENYLVPEDPVLKERIDKLLSHRKHPPKEEDTPRKVPVKKIPKDKWWDKVKPAGQQEEWWDEDPDDYQVVDDKAVKNKQGAKNTNKKQRAKNTNKKQPVIDLTTMTAVHHYTFHKKLKEGRYDITFLATIEDGRKVVIKMLKPGIIGFDGNKMLEFTMGRYASNQCIYAVKHFSAFNDFVPEIALIEKSYRSRYTSWLVLEYVEGYSLKQFIDCERATKHRLTVMEYLKFLERIFSMLACFHRSGVIHGELVPDHIYFGNRLRQVFLVDFSSSCYIEYDPNANYRDSDSFYACALRNIMTPRIYSSKFINLKRTRSPSEYRWSNEQLRTILWQNDIHCVITMSLELLYPNLTDAKNMVWLKGQEITGWKVRSFDLIQKKYEKLTNESITPVFKFLKKVVELINNMDRRVTAEMILGGIRTLKNSYATTIVS